MLEVSLCNADNCSGRVVAFAPRCGQATGFIPDHWHEMYTFDMYMCSISFRCIKWSLLAQPISICYSSPVNINTYYYVCALLSCSCANLQLFGYRLDLHLAEVPSGHPVPSTSLPCSTNQSALTCTSCHKVRIDWSSRWHCKTFCCCCCCWPLIINE